MVTSAAKISMGWLLSESLNPLAVPANVPRTDTGTPRPATASVMASVAADKLPPTGKSKLMVLAGVPDWWLTDSGAMVSALREKLASGTAWPAAVITFRLRSVSGPCKNSSANSITTRYWLSGL